jgi:acetylornithine deacetylase/succinyl-diaminopimelate desuccinylase-like protein
MTAAEGGSIDAVNGALRAAHEDHVPDLCTFIVDVRLTPAWTIQRPSPCYRRAVQHRQLLADLRIPATAGFGVDYRGLHGTEERIRLESAPQVQAVYHQALLALLHVF